MNEEGKARYLIQSLTLDWGAFDYKIKFLLSTLKGGIKNLKKGLSVELSIRNHLLLCFQINFIQ